MRHRGRRHILESSLFSLTVLPQELVLYNGSSSFLRLAIFTDDMYSLKSLAHTEGHRRTHGRKSSSAIGYTCFRLTVCDQQISSFHCLSSRFGVSQLKVTRFLLPNAHPDHSLLWTDAGLVRHWDSCGLKPDNPFPISQEGLSYFRPFTSLLHEASHF
ncbi:unnamed protein product [Protopolystoma xenopodis]|uniref:Uncharacterized protein n=1 Tax=Protopolystoma xenopodis TaxID=117903 RepID=A0A3S5AW08_9PLAT|nr:unnamed protein product [Protopolystoma xenopodis]